MKKFIKGIVRLCGLIIHHVFPYSLSQKLYRFKGTLYTAWIAPNFRYLGANSKIEPGLYLVNGKYIKIGKNCIIGYNSFITAIDSAFYFTNPKIEIGDNCIFGSDIHITAANYIKIGNNVRTGKSILISDNFHGNPNDKEQYNIAPNLRSVYSKGSVIIGDNVWIGEKVAIMPGVTIGNGTVIGANSVVTKSLPNFCVAVGCPATIIKKFQE